MQLISDFFGIFLTFSVSLLEGVSESKYVHNTPIDDLYKLILNSSLLFRGGFLSELLDLHYLFPGICLALWRAHILLEYTV